MTQLLKRFRLTSDINVTSSPLSAGDQGTSTQQSDNSHKDEPPNSLLRLNDDCLRHVFKYSDEEDLCGLANVCTRMRPIAEQTFHKRYKEKDFEHWKFGESLFRRVFH